MLFTIPPPLLVAVLSEKTQPIIVGDELWL